MYYSFTCNLSWTSQCSTIPKNRVQVTDIFLRLKKRFRKYLVQHFSFLRNVQSYIVLLFAYGSNCKNKNWKWNHNLICTYNYPLLNSKLLEKIQNSLTYVKKILIQLHKSKASIHRCTKTSIRWVIWCKVDSSVERKIWLWEKNSQDSFLKPFRFFVTSFQVYK